MTHHDLPRAVYWSRLADWAVYRLPLWIVAISLVVGVVTAALWIGGL